MIEFLEGHLFVMSVAALHLANGKTDELKETAKQARTLLRWRETKEVPE
jgi:hypothetical protein